MMGRKAIEFTPYTQFPAEPVPGPAKGITQRIISKDPQGRALSRIIEYEAGTDTTPNGTAVHDYWEEVFILKGKMIDLTLNQTFSAGDTASRPPGMPHGPWKIPEHTVIYEVDYYVKED